MRPNKIKTGGFTLIEAMVSISIFAFIGLGSYAILDNIVRVQERSTEKSAGLALLQKVSLQRGRTYFSRDGALYH